ncbi:MAG: hypothetical protein E7Z94_02285 [Actinomyces ruminicola]|nr:hypothetical protein [Actinomyces ruminicola]
MSAVARSPKRIGRRCFLPPCYRFKAGMPQPRQKTRTTRHARRSPSVPRTVGLGTCCSPSP